jgi:hypothetical protein
MSTAYIIEILGESVGIVARDKGGFRFYAADHAYNALEGAAFPTPQQAERAARRLTDQRVTSRPRLT